MAQGTRVTGNLFHDNDRDVFVEVNHGPFLLDNNILLSNFALWESSQGGAYVHNLIAGEIKLREEVRFTPYFKAHTIEDMRLSNFTQGDERYHNNLIVGYSGLSVYSAEAQNIQAVGNVFLAGAKPSVHDKEELIDEGFNPHVKLVQEPDGWSLALNFDPSWMTIQKRNLVTTHTLGLALVSLQAYENPDGSPLRIETDYFGEMRNIENPAPGSFRAMEGSSIYVKVWPK